MRRSIISVLLIGILVFTTGVPCFAAEKPDSGDSTVETIYYDDGSYATLETTVDENNTGAPGIAPMAAYQTKSGTSNYTYYNKSGAKAWTMTLSASFKYNGSSAQATASSVSHKIHVSGWSCSSKNATKSGATATGHGVFKYATLKPSITIKMTCSASGKISAKAY